MASHDPSDGASGLRFAHKAAIASAVAVLVFGLGHAFVQGFSLVMLLFGAVLVAVFLRGLAELLASHTPLKPRWAVAVLLVVIVAAAGLVIALAAPMVGARLATVGERLPDAAAELWARISASGVGPYLPDDLLGGEATALSTSQIRASASAILGTGFGVVADLAVVLIVGIYLAISPSQYTGGLLHLVPKGRRQRAEEVVELLRSSLGWWLVGRLSSMALVGVASAVGLALIGVPLPWTLGLLTGLLCFVPFIGPLVAVVPPLLFAWTGSSSMALAVLGLYFGIQMLESYVVTPLIQQRTVMLPAALVIGAQAVIGFAAGPVGVMLAVPLAVVLMVVVRELYVVDVLGDDTVGEGEGER